MPGQVGAGGGSGGGSGTVSGTANTVAKFTSASAVGNSRITDNGTNINADSGAGAFQAGDFEFDFNGTHLILSDSGKTVELQADGSGNTQSLFMDGTGKTITLTSNDGLGGSVGFTLAADAPEVAITGDLIPSADGASDLGSLNEGFGVLFSHSLSPKPTAFASLPASPREGTLAWITDSTVNTWGTQIAGGGANKVLGVYTGAIWTVVGR